MEGFECSPQIKQVAAVLMRLYPKYRLDIHESYVKIIFNGSLAYTYRYDSEGYLDGVEHASYKSSSHGGIFYFIEAAIVAIRKFPEEEEVYLKICEECQNGDIEKDIEYFDNNFEIYHRTQVAYRWRSRINTVLLVCAVLVGYGLYGGWFDPYSVFPDDAVKALYKFGGSRTPMLFACVPVIVLALYNLWFAVQHARKRKRGLVF